MGGHAFFRSRIARRIVGLFLACAAVPVCGLAYLAFDRVREVLVAEGHLQLAHLSEGYGAALHGRLLLLEHDAESLAAALGEKGAWRESDRMRLAREFSFGAVVEKDGSVTPLAGDARVPELAPEIRKHIARGRTAIVVPTPAALPGSAIMVHAIDAARPDEGRLVLGLPVHDLWGDPETFAAATDFCVASAGVLLMCSDPGLVEAVRPIAGETRTRATGRREIMHGEKRVLVDYRELFLAPRFGLQGLTIMALRDEAVVLAPLRAFSRLFVPVVLLALALAALLSIWQVRRTLVPLDCLIDGTRRVAQRDFSQPVPVLSRDEFGELAQSFNAMTSRLSRQFTTLLTLSDVDRAILAREEIERVLETVVTRMAQSVPAPIASVAIVDRHATDTLLVHTRDAEGVVAIEHVAANHDDLQALRLSPQGAWVTDDRGSAHACGAFAAGADVAWMLPILWQDEVVGAVVLGFHTPAALEDDAQGRARDLADRIGVAFAAAAKDEQLYFQTHYDALTRLPNRHSFRDQLDRALADAERTRDPFALLVVDLDGFKSVNDSLGHAVGDAVLREAALRLSAAVRRTDAVARLGGDEFTVILTGVQRPRDPMAVAREVIGAMVAPFVVAGQEHFLSASIGIAVYPGDGENAEDLLRHADTAMQRAKQAGRAQVLYFEERMNVVAHARIELERELRRALQHRELVVHYQAQHDLATGAPSGAEALVRWQHPERGLLPPGEFIELAEETGIIDRLGEYVLRESLRQLRAWRNDGMRLSHVAVNVSARQFRQPGFHAAVTRALMENGLSPSSLELEITESLLIDAPRTVETVLGQFRALGVRIALDDFGTGYSSLSYLKRFPVDVVKIDRAFVRDLPGDPSSVAITGAVVAMAHALGKEVVAEGVETADQARFLHELGCDVAQGYHLAPPLDADGFARYLAGVTSTLEALPRVA